MDPYTTLKQTLPKLTIQIKTLVKILVANFSGEKCLISGKKNKNHCLTAGQDLNRISGLQ